jgi:HPt (histidine-containing phosphotransfer) domain-containing protein
MRRRRGRESVESIEVNSANTTTLPGTLTSDLLRDDPEMHDLVQEFIDGLPGRIADLRQAQGRLDWDVLAKLAHQLKGAGGSYGYPDLSRLGAQMEEHFRAHSIGSFSHWMEQLEHLTGAARAGLQKNAG